MSTYRINTENTGLDTDAKARRMAEILSAQGYDVEFTRNYGLVNPTASCPCDDRTWESAMIQADNES